MSNDMIDNDINAHIPHVNRTAVERYQLRKARGMTKEHAFIISVMATYKTDYTAELSALVEAYEADMDKTLNEEKEAVE